MFEQGTFLFVRNIVYFDKSGDIDCQTSTIKVENNETGNKVHHFVNRML